MTERGPLPRLARLEGELAGEELDNSERPPDVTIHLLKEHALFRQAAGELRAHHLRSRRVALARSLSGAIARHEAAEEVVLLPLLSRLEHGDAVREQLALGEHELSAASRRITRRMLLRSSGRKTRRMLADFDRILARHLDYEEQTALAGLAALEGEQERRSVGRLVQLVEYVAPRHPRPHRTQGALRSVARDVSLGAAERFLDRVVWWSLGVWATPRPLEVELHDLQNGLVGRGRVELRRAVGRLIAPIRQRLRRAARARRGLRVPRPPRPGRQRR